MEMVATTVPLNSDMLPPPRVAHDVLEMLLIYLNESLELYLNYTKVCKNQVSELRVHSPVHTAYNSQFLCFMSCKAILCVLLSIGPAVSQPSYTQLQNWNQNLCVSPA